MEQVTWKVEGMDCASCAAAITKSLQKQGASHIRVNHVNGNVSFETTDTNTEKAAKEVEALGYTVKTGAAIHQHTEEKKGINKNGVYLLLCLPFTLLLLAHMVLPWPWLHNPFVQLGLSLPVYIIGMSYFGVSAWKNLSKGAFHMNVLIALGATAAMVYSCIGLFTGRAHEYLFFETAASILTIVFFGNWLEDCSIRITQRQIKQLTHQQPVMANMIAYDDQHEELVFPIENKDLKSGDLVLIRTGEEVPADCKILWGEAEVNEAILTGESLPLHKKQNDVLIGGSVISNGQVKAYVTAAGQDTVRSGIVRLMQEAQNHKPPVQLLADKISNIFVPTVLIISAVTLVGNLLIGPHTFAESLMRSIAVLVISCPCAMGLATPAALAVGMGRAARKGILYARPESMEAFKTIRQMVFDKTGTLTTGQFSIADFKVTDASISEADFKTIVYSLEKLSQHPIAKSITTAWQQKALVKWKRTQEVKGLGMKGEDKEGNTYAIGSAKIDAAITDNGHHLYVIKNGSVIGWINIEDELRPEAKAVVDYCHQQRIKTILLSGDTKTKCEALAQKLGIAEVLAEQTPAQKLQQVERLTAIAPTAMVGDGINDAPALAKATISISVAQASQLAVQSAHVVLTAGGLQRLPQAMQLGKATYNTVRSNLFWAFIYNIVAIPVAALGYLRPEWGALIMGGSDVVLALNSLWLGVKPIGENGPVATPQLTRQPVRQVAMPPC